MIHIQNIENVNDCVPLYLPHSLYLKPLAKMHISVALPYQKAGQSISNLILMEKLSAALKPDKFFVIKVAKSSIDVVRFEAELDERARLFDAIKRLDGFSFRVTGFNDKFRVRAAEAKDEFPTMHDWDVYFRDAKDMNAMKPGERPDTIHFTHLPIRWFCARHMEQDDVVKPSESIFKRMFAKFGSVRFVDIPICDPYRSKMKKEISGMQTFSVEQDVLFEAYVQFEEYAGFKRAMDEFRGMKLVRKFVDKTQAINITVNFDKTKHLSDAKIRRRELMIRSEQDKREKQKRLEQEKLEEERKKQEEQRMLELQKQQEKEAKRKEKHLKVLQERGQVEISQKIRLEERRLIIAQRKLESIRLLELLFERLVDKHNAATASTRKQYEAAAEIEEQRVRLVTKYKEAADKLVEEQKQKVKEMKMATPLRGLLKSKPNKIAAAHSDDDGEANGKAKRAKTVDATLPQMSGINGFNPFKAAAVAAAANAGVTTTTTAANSINEVNNEWAKTMPNMFSYVPQMFPGMPMYRPPAFGMPFHYRGYAPRPRGRGRGRARGRGNYDGSYNNYKHHNYDDDGYEHDDDEDEEVGGSKYYKSSYSRSRNRSRSRTRSRHRYYSKRSDSSSSSRSRSRTRSRQRHHSSRSYERSRTKSRNRSRSHNRSRSRSTSKTKNNQRKLASTRRSRTVSSHSSDSRSRSRQRSKRGWSRRGVDKRRSNSSSSRHQVILKTDELVRSAELIKDTIEKNMQERMREEEREIKQHFSRQSKPGNATEMLPRAADVVASPRNGARSSRTNSEERVVEHERNSSSRSRAKSRPRSRSCSMQRTMHDEEAEFEQVDELVLEAEDKEDLA